MSCFIDLYTEPVNVDDAVDIVRYAGRLGYCIVGMRPFDPSDWSRIVDEGLKVGVKMVKVYRVKGSNRGDVAGRAAKAPRGVILVAEAKSQEIARYASVNKRFAGYIVVPGMERIVDRSTRNLFRERGWGVVIVLLRYLLGKRDKATWRYYYLSLRRGFAYNVDIALASGARDSSELWHPMSAAGVASIVGVPGEYARLWLTSAPARLIDAFQRR
ncbi:MAG: hypothetical protein F7C38_03925 [Desulfurococcales archaeon]|nr:hypothetical protein [Desulfurococcales archaeon]